MENEKEVYTKREFNFQQSFLNWNCSFVNGAKLIKFGSLVVECNSERELCLRFLIKALVLIFL